MLAAFLKFAAFFIMLPFYNYVVAANLHAAFLDCSLFTFRPSKKTWYYDEKWHIGPDLQKGRTDHSVGIVRDSVTDQVYLVVAGGWDGSILNDVEILSVTGTAWEPGNLL